MSAPDADRRADPPAGPSGPGTRPPRRPRRWIWPAAVVILLGGHATLWIVFAALAVGDPSVSVEPEYYRQALEWDSTAAQIRANGRLGWSAGIETSGDVDAGGGRSLRCTVRDGAGAPIAGARVSLVAFPHARGTERLEMDLSEGSPGVYSGSPRMSRRGLWECRVTVRRGAETFTHRAIHEVTGPGGGPGWRS